VGCAGHYDVEPAEDGWTVDPYAVTERDGRLYARGIGDNLGPLLLRLEAIASLDKGPSIVMVLQGEEEIGSPAAHRLYPDLDLPPVSLWMEETGYFERNGDARILARRLDDMVRPAIEEVEELTRSRGREVEYHDRYLNKAFGQHRCPFLVHLAGDVPYLALGPNDPDSNIHAPDESLAIRNLGLAHDQQVALLEALGDAVA
jgi:acetylornithine deacetylase/succinyl-diaminopimelate desuccinylase-like protein